MSIDLGEHKPVIKLVRQFVGEDKTGRSFPVLATLYMLYVLYVIRQSAGASGQQ